MSMRYNEKNFCGKITEAPFAPRIRKHISKYMRFQPHIWLEGETMAKYK